MRILVTDGDNRASLAIVRSLGRAGHWIAVGGRATDTLAHSSRFCTAKVTYPDPVHHEGEFTERIHELVGELQLDAVMPVTDITTRIVTEQRFSFPHTCRVPFGDASVIAAAADKIGVLRTAIRLGVPVPRTVVLDDRRADVGSLPYPLVIKPGRSRVRTRSGWLSCSVSYAANEAELRADLAGRRDEEFPLALQEKVAGPGVGVFLCIHDGQTVARFAHRRLREKPPSGGVSVLAESTEPCPQALSHAERLLHEIGWEGVAMVEFKRDERDGLPKLMEINGRFWGSLQLAIDAGVDFPSILLQTLAGDVPAPPTYRLGVRSRWLWGDVDALLIQLLHKPGSASTPRLRALADFFKLWQPGLRYENPRWDDLRPWWFETRSWLTGAR